MGTEVLNEMLDCYSNEMEQDMTDLQSEDLQNWEHM